MANYISAALEPCNLNQLILVLSRRPTPLSCFTFGSPPVLAHEMGGGGARALDILGLPPQALRNFALENDPIPRALLSVDPTFEMIKQWDTAKALLQLRERLVGKGSPLSTDRFLFETVGELYLIKWTPEGESMEENGGIPMSGLGQLHLSYTNCISNAIAIRYIGFQTVRFRWM